VGAMTPRDYESVEGAGRVLHERGWREDISVNEMTDSWRRIVAEIETGYDQVVEEYVLDLSCRDWLALAWPMFSERVRSVRQAELDALDARFMAATVEDTEGRFARFSRAEGEDGWWRLRLPARRHGEFARDVDQWSAAIRTCRC
jgi:hypothetical protein